MKKATVFSQELMTVMQNAMDIVEENGIERATPIVMFKGIIDLETNPLYEYISNNTYQENEIIESLFDDAFYCLRPLKVKKQKEGQEEVVEEKEEKKINDCYFADSTTNATLIYTEEVAALISRAIQIAAEKKSEIVQLEYFLNAIAEKIPKDILQFLRNADINVKDFKKEFTTSTSKEARSILPQELKSFMKVLNEQQEKNTKCTILGRDKECDMVWKTMQKKTKRNVILIGKPGVGKSSIAKKIAHDIVNGNCPEKFKDFVVISVNINATIAGTQYRGDAEERFQNMIDFLEKTNNVVLFIDEIHTILGAGACREGEMDLANALKPILAEDKVYVIGATTEKEYEKYFSSDGALKRRFRPIQIKEPTSKEVYPMLKNAIASLSKYHEIKISKAMIEYIILISSCFNYETSNPDRTIDLVDLSMVTAKAEGKMAVDRESVLKNFAIEFKKFNKMDYKTKKATAYHEAGHYLVGRLSEHLTNIEGIAISIMPAEDYLGITVFDELDDEVTVSGNMQYFIDGIALSLAGRVAEKMYTKTISSGASGDLNQATRHAYKLVTRYGCQKTLAKTEFTLMTKAIL